MNLVIDVGNTFSKVAVFQKDTLIKLSKVGSGELLEEIKIFLKELPIHYAILSSVGVVNDEVVSFLKERIEFLQMSSNLTLPFVNKYATPHTLGQDRVALAAGAVSAYPDSNVLVIDAGTCITYDVVTAKKEYLGGAISPGLQMRFNALHTFTAKLPLIVMEDEAMDEVEVVGSGTKSGMISGVVNGVILEIEGFIANNTNKFKDLTVILTGGNGYFLSKRLKNGIFANSNFLVEGLNVILEHNKHE